MHSLEFEVLPPVRNGQPPQTRTVWHKLDLSVPIIEPNRVVFHSESRFGSWRNAISRKFLEQSFGIREVREVEIDTLGCTATLSFDAGGNPKRVLRKIARVYRGEQALELNPTFPADIFRVLPKTLPRLRAFRYGETISTWELRLGLPGWMRLRNALVINKRHFGEALERELLSVMGVEEFRLHPNAGSISVAFNPSIIRADQVVRQLDLALLKAPVRRKKSSSNLQLRVATGSLMLSTAATFFAPLLLPIGAALMLYTAIPSFRRAWRIFKTERRLCVDVLDSMIFIACLFTGRIFVGAVAAWFLSFGRKLLRDTRKDSANMLLQTFGKQPTTARVLRGDQELEVTLSEVQLGERIVTYTGEIVPVDGVIEQGDAILDQHALTGESAPAEKGIGDKVYASTLMLAGKAIVRVERAGKETASSKISEVLKRTVAYKLQSQSRGEDFADLAVVPALGLSTLAAGVVNPSAALAVINSECGTGIRMAAPLGMLTSLTLCAQHGILIKDGRALEMMRRVDTVLFDKTGTLTRERPEVGRILCCGTNTPEHVLSLAAAAEQRFTHPIARAILERFQQLKRPLPQVDMSKYHVGFGITVEIEGEIIRVGSKRFLAMERISIPAELEHELARIHTEGNSFVTVAVGDHLAGVLELRSSHRPEAEAIVEGLRAQGVRHMAIISGDHEAPTRRLSEQLGMDRYFAEVLPQEKARYVELLQREGRIVCFVGDGINDSIALKKANVSISLRGASTIATDTAQIVFMEESLAKICTLMEVSHALESNVRRSWRLILLPNTLCVAGVFMFGFNIWHSVLFNNISTVLGLANGMLPLRRAQKVRENKILLNATSYRNFSADQPRPLIYNV
ncbi:MAG: heavy metal translocating P-type ATPase [Verrucomicrobia bacterium]|nr:heavy metal translocating P-type ATPase [Verrucomicrobiota bacterium]